jgi:hypothetical protein
MAKTHKCKVCKKNIRQSSGPGRPKLTHAVCKKRSKKTPVRRKKKARKKTKKAKKKTKKVKKRAAKRKPRGARSYKPTKKQFGGSKMDSLDRMEYRLALDEWKELGYWVY